MERFWKWLQSLLREQTERERLEKEVVALCKRLDFYSEDDQQFLLLMKRRCQSALPIAPNHAKQAWRLSAELQEDMTW